MLTLLRLTPGIAGGLRGIACPMHRSPRRSRNRAVVMLGRTCAPSGRGCRVFGLAGTSAARAVDVQSRIVAVRDLPVAGVGCAGAVRGVHCRVREDGCTVREDGCAMRGDDCAARGDLCAVFEDGCAVFEDVCAVRGDARTARNIA